MKKRFSLIFLLSALLACCGSDPTGPSGDSAGVLELTSASFAAQILQSPRPSLVEFYSPSCSACASMAPAMESLATRYAGRAVVGKVDIAREITLLDAYEIYFVPTFIFFKNGVERGRIVGAVQEAELAAAVENLLAAGS
ncbi:MAG: thiol reductase thioredoxin [Vicinamibacteria bacterium]|nr:thiol reductase thioredoxin [Vicinamibacteria bacterium]